jgi:Flp pilus assembly protein TadD
MSKAGSSETLVSDFGNTMLKQASSDRRTEFAQAVMDRGLSLFRSGEFDSADLLFATMEQEPAVRPLALHIRGVIALHRGEDERALDLIEEAIRLNPADSEAHANLGLLLLKVRQNPQALAAYAASLTLRPDNPAAQFGLARAFSALDMPISPSPRFATR